MIAALNDYRLLPSEAWEKVATLASLRFKRASHGRTRALWLAQNEPSSALSGTFSHASHGRRQQFQKPSLLSPNSPVSTS